MRGHRLTGITGVSFALLTALLALYQAATAQVADRKNHYILDCDDACQADAALKAIGAPHGIATDATGNVYFTTQHVVFKLARDGALTRLAGTGEPGYSGDGGPATDARLNIPLTFDELEMRDEFAMIGAVAVDDAGNVFVADAYNNRIRRVGLDGVITTTQDLLGGVNVVHWPQGLAFDATGNLYVADMWGRIARRGPDGRLVDVVMPGCDSELVDCSFGAAQIAVDSGGAVYFGNLQCEVRKWSEETGEVVAIGSGPVLQDGFARCAYRGDGGPASEAGLAGMPYGVAVDRANQVYIADTFSHCVRRVDAAGVITTFAGRCDDHVPWALGWPPGVADAVPGATLGDGSTALGARLFLPMGVAVDLEGNVYIADTGHLRVRKVTPDGVIRTVAGNGRPLNPTELGSATPPR